MFEYSRINEIVLINFIPNDWLLQEMSKAVHTDIGILKFTLIISKKVLAMHNRDLS